ncbi:MAG: hypothetical protein ACLQGP_24965 [Isosphaeraceae bacterium]
MRQARCLPPTRHRSWKVIPACLLGFVGWGCAQPPTCFYYGYGAPPCAQVMPAPGGTPCDPPAPTLGPTTTSDAGTSSSAVANTRNTPRVVVSEPDNGMRLPWKRSNPDAALATTSVEGAVSDSSVNR